MLKFNKPSFMALIAVTLCCLSLQSWASTPKTLSIYFHNCINSQLNIEWNAYKYNVNAPLDPNHLKTSGSFSLDKSTSINVYPDTSFFSLANGEINFKSNTPRGPIWIRVDSKGIPTVLQGAAGIDWQYYQESLRFDIDCPWG